MHCKDKKGSAHLPCVLFSWHLEEAVDGNAAGPPATAQSDPPPNVKTGELTGTGEHKSVLNVEPSPVLGVSSAPSPLDAQSLVVPQDPPAAKPAPAARRRSTRRKRPATTEAMTPAGRISSRRKQKPGKKKKAPATSADEEEEEEKHNDWREAEKDNKKRRKSSETAKPKTTLRSRRCNRTDDRCSTPATPSSPHDDSSSEDLSRDLYQRTEDSDEADGRKPSKRFKMPAVPTTTAETIPNNSITAGMYLCSKDSMVWASQQPEDAPPGPEFDSTFSQPGPQGWELSPSSDQFFQIENPPAPSPSCSNRTDTWDCSACGQRGAAFQNTFVLAMMKANLKIISWESQPTFLHVNCAASVGPCGSLNNL